MSGLPFPVTAGPPSGPSSGPSSGPRLQQSFQDFQNFLSTVPADARRYCAQLWQNLRPVIRDLENASNLPSASEASPSRPTTSDSVQAIRTACDEAFSAAAAGTEPPAKDLLSLSMRDAVKFLESRSNRSSEVECWMSTNVPAHTSGYVKFNMRNSTFYSRSGSGRELKLGNEYAHHIALAAKGDWDSLSLVAQHGDYEVSHLCHYSGCFNPEHLIVEPKNDNKSRQVCHGAYLIESQCECGRAHKWDPCPHERLSAGRRCILATRVIASGSGYWENRDGSGPQLRQRPNPQG